MKLKAFSIAIPMQVAAACTIQQVAAQETGPWAPHNGLQITRAYTSDYGPDAEEFNTIVSVNSRGIVIDYTDTRGTVARRRVRASDRFDARNYLIGFAAGLPNEVPGTTSLGISTSVLEQLRAEGRAPLALVYDTSLTPMNGELTLVKQRVKVPVLVENQVVHVFAMASRGTFKRGKRSAVGQFVFLDDKVQPALIAYTIQFDFEKRPRTVRTVRVTSGRSQQAAMEQTLRTIRKLELYGIHFSFDRASIRPEARSLITDIATTLKNNPNWTIAIQGHTDSIGAEDYNLALSDKRARAIRAALVKRHKIDPGRLDAVGFGESQPKASNDDLHGRALNRRVELVRTDR